MCQVVVMEVMVASLQTAEAGHESFQLGAEISPLGLGPLCGRVLLCSFCTVALEAFLTFTSFSEGLGPNTSHQP